MLKHIPVVIRLRQDQIKKADVAKDLRIDRHSLDKELSRHPGVYAWWAALYSEAASKVDYLKDKLETLEAKLTLEYRHGKHGVKIYQIKDHIRLSHRYLKLKGRMRKWEDAERQLKHFVRAFEQRHQSLMAINANVRKEKEHQ